MYQNRAYEKLSSFYEKKVLNVSKEFHQEKKILYRCIVCYTKLNRQHLYILKIYIYSSIFNIRSRLQLFTNQINLRTIFRGEIRRETNGISFLYLHTVVSSLQLLFNTTISSVTFTPVALAEHAFKTFKLSISVETAPLL